MPPKYFLLLLFISIESNSGNDERENINNIEFVKIIYTLFYNSMNKHRFKIFTKLYAGAVSIEQCFCFCICRPSNVSTLCLFPINYISCGCVVCL